MTNYTTLSDSELTEALNFHRRQRNMSRGINEAAHARQTQMVRMLEAEEARRLNEEKPNKYVIYKHKDKYGVSQDIGTGYNWDHSYHHGYHDTVDAAKAWAAKHAGKYPHNVTVKEEKVGLPKTPKNLRYSKKAHAKNIPSWARMNVKPTAKDKEYSAAIATKRFVKEEVDLDEGIKDTFKSIKKHAANLGDKFVQGALHGATFGMMGHDTHDPLTGDAYDKVKPFSNKLKKKMKEEVEQIDEISSELKKRYVEKGADDVVDRFTGRGKYERPHNPAHFTKTGRVKKSALNRPEAIKYREKLDNRRDIVNKVSQEVHGKKRFGEEVEINEAAMDKNHPIVKEYQAMKKHDIKTLRGMIAGQRRVSDTSEFKTKDHAISSYLRAKHGNKAVDKAFGFNEEVEINEASDLRITKIYNKWPKKATYAVHNANRSYFKEFDSEEAARAHHKEKTAMKEEVFTEAKLERNKNTVGAHHLERDSGDHKMYTAYTGSLVRRLHTVTDKDDNILGQGTSAASAMAKAKLKKPHRDALMHDSNQIINVHDTRGAHNVGTQVATPGKGRWFKDHEEAIAYAKSLPGKIRHADPKTGHVD